MIHIQSSLTCDEWILPSIWIKSWSLVLGQLCLNSFQHIRHLYCQIIMFLRIIVILSLSSQCYTAEILLGLVVSGYTGPVHPACSTSPYRILYLPLINVVSLIGISTRDEVEFCPDMSGHTLRLSMRGSFLWQLNHPSASELNVEYQSAMCM